MRLIDADALKRKFRNVNEGIFQLSRVYELIDNAPTVERSIKGIAKMNKNGDVEIELLRPHGKWIEEEGTGLVGCSYCHTVWLRGKTAFCPNCGADMRKEANNE